MLTLAEGRKQKRALDRARAVALKIAARAKVAELRAAVARARGSKAQQIRAARALCRSHRRLLVQRAKARRVRLLEELRENTKAEKRAAHCRCKTSKERARESALSSVEQARHALHHERAYQADLKRIEANNRRARLGITRPTASERRSESDYEVEGNIPPELVPLWRRVGRRIKGSSRKSRSEAFVEYAAEHAREVVEAQEGGVDAEIRKLEAQQARAHRLAKTRRYTAAELAAVPF